MVVKLALRINRILRLQSSFRSIASYRWSFVATPPWWIRSMVDSNALVRIDRCLTGNNRSGRPGGEASLFLPWIHINTRGLAHFHFFYFLLLLCLPLRIDPPGSRKTLFRIDLAFSPSIIIKTNQVTNGLGQAENDKIGNLLHHP